VPRRSHRREDNLESGATATAIEPTAASQVWLRCLQDGATTMARTALFSPEIVDQIVISREQFRPLFLAEIVDQSFFFLTGLRC
jgi:hypothetical protein